MFRNARIIFASKWTTVTNIKKNLLIYRFAEQIQYAHLFPLHNKPDPMPVGWKLWEE